MNLSNRFKNEDKLRVWLGHEFCAICMSNQQCSLHHVRGSKLPNADSILNSCMLCHIHHSEADSHNVSDKEYQAPLLQYTMRQVLKSGYTLKQNDIDFYTANKVLYNNNK